MRSRTNANALKSVKLRADLKLFLGSDEFQGTTGAVECSLFGFMLQKDPTKHLKV